MSEEKKNRDMRFVEEASFFDQQAETKLGTVSPIADITLLRYREKRRKRFKNEFRLLIAGDLRGKSILDLGCGEGGNSILLGHLGAKVVGLDVSPKAIELANEKAKINGLESQVSFICSPIESSNFQDSQFDIIWGDNVLHHLLPALSEVMDSLVRVTKPDGVMIFYEPVNLNNTLRRMRFLIPVHTEVTPGERPLNSVDLQIIEGHLAISKRRYYSLFGRLGIFILKRGNFEASSLLRRIIWNVVAYADYFLLTLPWVRTLAGGLVIWGPPRGKQKEV